MATGLKTRATWLLAICALTAVASAAFTYGAAAQHHKKSNKKSAAAAPAPMPQGPLVLVFPPDAPSGAASELTDTVRDVTLSRLTLSKRYQVLRFLQSLPTVKRALSQETLSETDVTAPFVGDERIRRVAQAAGCELALVSSIDDYEFDGPKQQVSVVMSARLLDFSTAKTVARSAAQNADTPPNSVHSASDVTAATALVRTLTDSLMTELLKPPAAPKAAGK